jgi:uncharacterized iron-regulated membrane protein
LSITFTLAAIANIAALMLKSQAMWIGLMALVPLVILLITGLYLFFQPYLTKWRGARGAALPSSTANAA